MNKQENILDFLNTESAEIHHAKLWKRLLAVLIDGLILYMMSAILSYVGSVKNVYISIFAVSILYKLGMEYIYGATVGKMIFKIEIVSFDTHKPSISQVILRNIVYVTEQLITILIIYKMISFDGLFPFTIPFGIHKIIFALIYCIDILVLLFNRNNQALHDLIAKTIVVQSNR